MILLETEMFDGIQNLLTKVNEKDHTDINISELGVMIHPIRWVADGKRSNSVLTVVMSRVIFESEIGDKIKQQLRNDINQ